MDNMNDPIRQIQQNKDALLQVMRSGDGQKLLRLLTGQSSGEQLKKAANAAAKGNTLAIEEILAKLMQSPEGAALVERINRNMRNNQ